MQTLYEKLRTWIDSLILAWLLLGITIGFTIAFVVSLRAAPPESFNPLYKPVIIGGLLIMWVFSVGWVLLNSRHTEPWKARLYHLEADAKEAQEARAARREEG